uniref:Uncharacterized protein n=1 Tax=Arundo donax TaxID=35708 RepID=A0A0A9AQV1_ARUDO
MSNSCVQTRRPWLPLFPALN